MKTKKQLAAAAAAAAASPTPPAPASDKKPAATSAASTTAQTSATPTPSSSTQVTTLKKPLKRLQSKAKDSPSPKAVPEPTSSGPAVVTTKPKPAGKSTPKNEVKSKKAPVAAGSKKSPAAATAPKKIQKELKNLGITDRAINQIDTAIVECNPSISEMVKTKSRATVSQLKYSDLGGGGSTPAKPVATATAGSSEVQKPTEPPTTVSTAVPTKKRPPPKTKDDSAKTQPDPVGREEGGGGGAKNKTPVTALATPSNSATATNPATAKEDVKAGPSNGGAKAKAKRPESKVDDNDGQAGGGISEQKSSPAKKNPTVAATAAAVTTAKPKPKSKKAILEEKKAAEVAAVAAAAAAVVATTKVEQVTVVQEVVPAKQRTPQVDDKNDEEKPCSLELDQDDKNESDVQSRIEDIMKALEESDGEEEGPPVPMPVLPTSSKQETTESGKVEVVQQVVDQDQEKKPTKVAAKPKVAAAKKKAPAKKKPVDDSPTVDQSKQESPVNKSEGDKSIKKTPTSQAKRKYVRKPTDGQASKSKVETKKSLEPVGTDKPMVDPVSEASPVESQKLEKVPDLPTPSEELTESPEPPKTIRSSTENDDDVPLNRLKDKTPKPPESTQESSFTVPNAPLLAALLTPSPATPSKTKRKYVRKPSTTPTSGSKKKPSSKVATPSDAKDKKPEKKDVYDFDDSDSENDAPVKAGKPFFKTTRKPLESSSGKEEEEVAEEATQAEVTTATPDPLESKSEQDPLKDSDSEEEKEFKKPAKKSTKSRNTPKQPSSEEDSEEEEDDKDADPDERPLTPMSKKIKREVRDSSEESNGDSDSSEESVRTRIVKKQLTAKTRHLKLYGFWSGPKRHRVASLNAIAKVHCLYENETRAALEASLMKQGPPRARAGTSKEVKKEKIEENEKKEEIKDEKSADKKGESEANVKQKEEKVTKEEPKKKVCKKTEPKEVKKKETKKVVVKEEKKDDKKKGAEKQKPASESESESKESSEEEVVTRTLRCVPGLRGAGKHWDPNASSMESEGDVLPDSDETYAQGKDTDPVKKRKVKRKVVKKTKPKQKQEKADKPKPPAKKIKKEAKAAQSDNDKKSEDESSGSGSESEKAEVQPAPKPKAEEVKKRKRKPKEKKEIVESTLGKKRMASLNATAMLAATYEVQRILYRNTDSDSDSPAEKPKAKKVKEQKESKEQKEAAKAEAKKEAKEQKESKEEAESAAEVSKAAEKEKAKEQKEKEKEREKVEKAKEKEKEREKEPLITVKTEPNRERREEHEVKREIEEPRPVSSNLVIAQDTEVTITGVYVNSSLGANQEAYCKMQYRVQQSVTEERLVRPGEAPPKSYTPLTALSSMRPPNDQTLATPPLFGPPSQCDSPLGLGPRSFYPPPTSSSGSSSAFCAPIPHGSPGYYQPAGPLISPHLLAQPIPVSQHGPGGSSSTITKQPPESDSPGVSSLVQPPSSSTADSTDSDVLLTAGELSSRSQQAAAAAAAYRYGSGPPNLYPRPMQMHCPPPHLAPNYYAAPPYSQYPPEMYYTHAAYPPAHFYPKFAQYYPPSRRYYAAPVSGEHLYEPPPPPPPSAGGPVPPPAGAQLVPAGPPQGPPPPPQHLEHYPGPPPYPYPGYGSPGPGPGGQCYSRNAYMDAHYTTNCPCPMQSCPKNVNAGSLIGIKASKGPVTTTATPTPQSHHHIASSSAVSSNSTAAAAAVQMSLSSSSACTTTMACNTEPIVISSGSSTSSSPPPLDIHSPIVASEPVVSSTVTTTVATVTTTTTTEPNTTAARVKPESELQHQYNSYHYHYPHRPSAPPPTHPLHSNYIPVGVVEVKQEPTAPTLESTVDSKTTKNIPKLLPLVVKQEITEVKQEPQPVTMAVVSCKKEDFEENGPAMTPDLLLDEALIKKEAMVTELVHHQLDDKRILSEILTAEANLITGKTLDNLNVSSNNQNNNNSSSISNEKVQLVDSILPEIPASTVKRRPLLVACKKSTPKKSPPNSYKNLIKRTNLGGDGEQTPEGNDEPTITVLSDDDDELEEDDDEVVVTSTPISRKPKRTIGKPRKLLKRTRRVFGAEQLRHLQKLNRSVLKSKRVRKLVKRPSCVPRNPAATEAITSVKEPEPIPVESVEVPELREEPPRPMSNVDLTIDLVAKGYFSEPEIATQAKSRAVKRLKQQEGRSQSEQNRGSSKKAKQQQLDDPLNVEKCPKVASEMAEQQSKGKSAKKAKKRAAASKSSKQNGKKRATSTPLPPEVVDQPEVNPAPLDMSAIDVEPTVVAADVAMDDRETDFDDAATMLVDDDMMSVDTNTMINRHNNNNNSTVENKNAATGITGTDPLLEEDPLTVEPRPTTVEVQTEVEDRLPTTTETAFEDDDEEEEEIMLARRFAKKSGAGGLKSRTSRSRSKSKSRKFSIKKRHRPARVAEVEEIIVPRKSNSVPRWSNGWTWEGQPFQGKVFLNSDDPPVTRTCYPAMRHSEGDIIRPRDSVLLRAGSKRAELPYVAKVAHLWENPEDGEMMMSLLWYYRPEHTEQGRQPVDGPDEVFASRHKDHNSVACIEDKCYVLTFSEYCRFRRQLRGFEENIDEQPSIVPPLRRENPRLPPSIVSPELVMYCQRVYEFRLKRLLKQPS